MKTILSVIIAIIIVLVAAIWIYSDKNSHAAHAKDDIKSAATETKEFVQDKLGKPDLNLNVDNIKDELARTGQVVREKAQQAGAAIADATADARITATIKAKLVKDQSLSSLNISVKTENGLVTLSGSASSPENIQRAIQLAMETDGVHKVVSTLQVKS